MVTQSLKFIFILANSVGPDIMPHFVAFNLSSKYAKKVSSIQRVEVLTHQTHFGVRPSS